MSVFRWLIVGTVFLVANTADGRDLILTSTVDLESTPRTKASNKTRSRVKASKKRRRRRRRRLHQLTDAPGLTVRSPQRAWGTRITVDRLKEVAVRYKQRFPDAGPLIVHDLSRRFGGRMPPHVSHRTGRDVDIRVLLNRKTRHYVKATSRTLHREKMWFLLTALIDTGDVEIVFLDRRLQRALYRYATKNGVSREEITPILQFPFGGWRAAIRHAKGHADHIHVRFRRRSRRVPVA